MTDWHAGEDQLVAFRDGSLAPVTAASVETHVVACGSCRGALRRLGAVAGEVEVRRERIWSTITDQIDRPSRGWHGNRWLRTTVGAPSLRWATVALVVALIAIPVGASVGNERAAVVALFALAPLAPVLGAVLAFRCDTDPAGELSAATPLVSMRLVLMRAAVVAAAATPVGVTASALLPVSFTLVIGWLLPSVGLCALVLASAARVDPTRFAAVLAAGWAAAVAAAFSGTRNLRLEAALEQLFVNQQLTQTVFGAVAIIAAIVVFACRDEARPWSTS